MTKQAGFEIKQELESYVWITRERNLTGISEILVLLLLLACILILPRLLKGVPAQSSRSSAIDIKKLGTKTRLGIVLSIVYPVGAALYLRPWDGHLISFVSFGILPVLLIWAGVWVMAARK